MDIETLLQSLLSAGRSGQFESARSLPGAGIYSEVLRLADRYRGTLLGFFAKLNNEDRCCFAKALAVYEDTVGGLGSVTMLHRLFPLFADTDHAVFDWVLVNTRSYWYYSHGAASYAGFEAALRYQELRRAESLGKEEERAAEARTRRAIRATSNLYNAVRRGDTNAVASLLDQGADPKSTTPEGVPLHEFAVSAGRIEIAKLLKGELGNQSAP